MLFDPSSTNAEAHTPKKQAEERKLILYAGWLSVLWKPSGEQE
jgi:hypothetical protein